MQTFKALVIPQLKGKIFWQNNNSTETLFLKRENLLHTVAQVDHVLVAEHMINFTVQSYELSEEYWTYDIHLKANANGTTYSGDFIKGGDTGITGKITCELFTNVNRYLLYGKWVEGDVEYSWQSVIERK